MRRLQGEDESVQATAAAGREERKEGGAAVSVSGPSASDGDEVELLLKSMQEDVKLDMEQVQRIGSLLAKPLLPSSSSSTSSSSARQRGQDAGLDDPRRLMAHLQSLPSTELAKLRQQRGRRRRRGSAKTNADESEEEQDSAEEEEDDASDVDAIVMQAMEEAKQA